MTKSNTDVAQSVKTYQNPYQGLKQEGISSLNQTWNVKTYQNPYQGLKPITSNTTHI